MKKWLLPIVASKTRNSSQGSKRSLGLASRRRAVSLKEAIVRVGESKTIKYQGSIVFSVLMDVDPKTSRDLKGRVAP
jgi:hypothetical protein